MKRALAILVALCTFGALGFSQIAIKGSWTATVCLLPTTSLTSTLSLTYTVAGFDVTNISISQVCIESIVHRSTIAQ